MKSKKKLIKSPIRLTVSSSKNQLYRAMVANGRLRQCIHGVQNIDHYFKLFAHLILYKCLVKYFGSLGLLQTENMPVVYFKQT